MAGKHVRMQNNGGKKEDLTSDMNEKFFDLKKEKRDRIINAGLKIFALNGYRHASTDEIVAEARISEGADEGQDFGRQL